MERRKVNCGKGGARKQNKTKKNTSSAQGKEKLSFFK